MNKITLSLLIVLLCVYSGAIKAEITAENFADSIDHDPSAAITLASTSLKLAKESSSLAEIKLWSNNLGLALQRTGQYEMALEHYTQYLSSLPDQEDKIGVLGNIGNVHFYMEGFAAAETFYDKSLALADELNNQNGKSTALNAKGKLYGKQEKYKEAITFFNEAYVIRSAENNKRGMAETVNNIALAYENLNLLDSALEYNEKSNILKEESGDQAGLAYGYNSRSILLKKLKRYDEAMEYGEKGMAIAIEVGAFEELKNSYENVSEILEFKEEFKPSYEYYLKFSSLKDSLFDEAKSKDIGKLEARYEFEKAEDEKKRVADALAKELAETKQRRDRLQYSGIFILILILFGGVSFLGFIQVTPKVAEGLIFFSFLILFEFALVMADPYIEDYSGGEPVYKLLFNAVLAGAIFPLHAFFERALKSKLVRK